MHAYEEIITDVNTEADKLISEEHPDSELIETKKQELNAAWEKIKAAAAEREKGLENNHEIQQFNRSGTIFATVTSDFFLTFVANLDLFGLNHDLGLEDRSFFIGLSACFTGKDMSTELSQLLWV